MAEIDENANPKLTFGRLPRAALSDSRLSARDLRVLAALYGHDMKNTGSVHPMRKSLAGITGLSHKRISETTTRLQRFGYVVKAGAGGRSCSCTYQLTVPVSGTVYDETVPEPGTKTVPEAGTKTDPPVGDTHIRDKEKKKEEREPHPLPDGFQPTDENRAWARQQKPGLDLDAFTEKFRLKMRANGEVCADWQAKWQTWVLTELVPEGSDPYGGDVYQPHESIPEEDFQDPRTLWWEMKQRLRPESFLVPEDFINTWVSKYGAERVRSAYRSVYQSKGRFLEAMQAELQKKPRGLVV